MLMPRAQGLLVKARRSGRQFAQILKPPTQPVAASGINDANQGSEHGQIREQRLCDEPAVKNSDLICFNPAITASVQK
jgi:hypothetical protein